MLFNTLEFIAFFTIVFCVYHILKRRNQNIFLLIASYVFYGAWDYRFCGLLFFSTIVSYICANRIYKAPPGSRERRYWLILNISANLGILGFFKYFNFFTSSAVHFLQVAGFQAHEISLQIILPVGISFFIFQAVGYSVDVYRNELKPTGEFISYALFIAFFPQLVAGPIERARNILPQLDNRRRLTNAYIREGVMLILIGFIRKVAIADVIAPRVGEIFSSADQSSPATLLIGVYLFALQIYGDFAGYTDIARGTARLLGIELMENFKQPYFSRSFSEFWKRWHVSLSSWLRDYLYIPLGGNRRGKWNTHRNLMITMLLGGLWHGAAWTYVLWGCMHGFFLVIEHRFMRPLGEKISRNGIIKSTILSSIQWCVVFHGVMLAWIFFRAASFTAATDYIKGLLNFSGAAIGFAGSDIYLLAYALLLLLIIDIPQFISRNTFIFCRSHYLVRATIYGLALGFILITWSKDYVPFIYFQF